MTAAARNTMGGERPRNADDAYYTPQPLADAICRRLRETIGVPYMIVEPSAGDGAFVRAAAGTWPKAPIFAVEPNADGTGDARDWAMWHRSTWEDFNWRGLVPETIGGTLIVGNPPFLLAESHVRIALDRLGHADATAPQPRWLAFLLRASFLAGDKRARGLHLDVGGLRYVWHVVGRPSFTGNGKTDGAKYAVLVWQAGYRGPYEGGWLTWREGSR